MINREPAVKHQLEIVQAQAVGKVVQVFKLDKDQWEDLYLKLDYVFDFRSYKYRLKPEPLPEPREFILELNRNGTVRNVLKSGEEPWFDAVLHIKVREVIDE